MYDFPNSALTLPECVESASTAGNFEVRGFSMSGLAAREETRPPRVVKVGLIQNSIVEDTTAGVARQRDAIFGKVGAIVDAAGHAGVNILCLQELWRKSCCFVV